MGCSCTKGERSSGSKKNDLRTSKNSFSSTESAEKCNSLAGQKLPLLSEKNTSGTNSKKASIKYESKETQDDKVKYLNAGDEKRPSFDSSSVAGANQVRIIENEEIGRARRDTNNLSISGVSALPERAKISKKNRQNNSLFKSFTNFFRDHGTAGVIDNSALSTSATSNNENKPVSQSLQQQTKTQSNKSKQDLLTMHSVTDSFQNSFSSSFSAKNSSPYSLLNLPFRSQCLVSSQQDIDYMSGHLNEKIARFKNELNHVQVYLSTPFSLSLPQTCATCGDKLAESSLFSQLRSYSTHNANSCDFNLISLDSINDSNQQTPSITQKYFRRALGDLVLRDLLNLDSKNVRQSTAGLFIFIVFLTDNDTGGENDLLCPNSIDVSAYEELLSRKFSVSEQKLFNKWYTLSSAVKLRSAPPSVPSSATSSPSLKKSDTTSNHYVLNTSKLLSGSSESNGELRQLLDALQKHMDEENSQKYLKTIQKSEIELVVKHIEPSAIIWLNMAESDSTNMTGSTSAVVDLLQSHVLAHNYKDFRIKTSVLEHITSSPPSSPSTAMSSKKVNPVKKLISLSFNKSNNSEATTVFSEARKINEFLKQSITSLIDTYASELNRHQINELALYIDKQLAKEIYSHYALYKHQSAQVLSKNDSSGFYNKFESSVNKYLKNEPANLMKTCKPLVIYKFKNEDASSGDCNFTSGQLVSKYLADIYTSNQSPVDLKNSLVIYRFCAHTIVSTNVNTLIQSIIHQICYILEIHESSAFDNSSNVVDKFVKALEKRQELNDAALERQKNPMKEESTKQQLLLILEGVERITRTQLDRQILFNFLNKLYKTSKTFCFNIKTILTYSIMSSLFDEQISPIEKIFGDCTVKLTNKNQKTTKEEREPENVNMAVELNSIQKRLQEVLHANGQASISLSSKLISILIKILCDTRYGLKQSEIISLLMSSLVSIHENQTNNEISYSSILVLWYTFKYHASILDEANLIETVLDSTGHILYRLSSECLVTLQNNSDVDKTNKLMSRLFEEALISEAVSSRIRAYEELPALIMAYNGIQRPDENSLLSSFILNTKWLVDKTRQTQNVLYFVQDLESFRRFVNHTHNHIEFDQFESIFYRIMYALHQDSLQFNSQFQTYSSKNIDSDRLYQNIVNNSNVQLIAINYKEVLRETFEQEAAGNSATEIGNKIAFNCLDQTLIYHSQVLFINSSIVVALSEAQKEIRIWEINSSSLDTSMNLIRTIKLNKSPKNIKLLDEQTAVILVDRNLHMFDLNLCKRTLDMNSTMSANVPFFEVHDQQHVVLLARNRLSVILMKVKSGISSNRGLSTRDDNSLNDSKDSNNKNDRGDTEEERAACESPFTKSFSAHTKNYSAEDDMFLFKAGEDRYLNSLMVSRNGQIMVCGDEVQKPFPLLVWNLNQRKLVYDLRQNKHEFITSIQAIGSTGRFIVCCCKEEAEQKNCLVVYDLSTGQLFKKLKAKVNYMAVEINEELNVIVACLENAQIIVYDLTSGSEKNTILSNRYPVNNLKLLRSPSGVDYILTYDTKGCDWTIRLWHLDRENTLLSAFTCPSRIVSLSVNTGQLYFGHELSSDPILLAVSLYGFKQLLLIKLDETSHTAAATSLVRTSFDSNLDGITKEIII